MSARADYKLTDIGEIPEDWEVVRIGQVCEVGTGGTPSTAVTEYYENGNIRWMKSADVKGPYVYDVPNRITGSGLANSNAVVHPPGSVMMAMSGRGKTRGSTAVLAVPCTCSQSVAAIIPDKDRLSPEFLHYDLEFRYEETRNITGSYDRSGLNLKLIRDIKIPRPRLAEQQKIAGILLAVDFSLQKTDEIIAKTQQLKKGLMQQLLTRGIGHTKFKQTELGEVPQEWNVMTLNAISVQGTRNGLYKPQEFFGRGIKVVRMTEIFRGDVLDVDAVSERVELTKPERSKFAVREGDLLFARRSMKVEGSGRCVMVPEVREPMVFESSIVRLTPNKSVAYPKFFLYYLTSSLGRKAVMRIVRTVAVSGVTGEDLGKILVPVPTVREQQEIAQILTGIESKLATEEKRKAQLHRIKTGLMQVLLTGKVRVKVD